METDGEQNQQGASANGGAASGASSRPSAMNSMTLYERQAVQALQALQRQPNAAQYFQQLMLQQQISSAQLQNLAAVQQVKATLAAGRQSGASSGSSSLTSGSTATTSASPASSRSMGASAASSINQSVLLSGVGGGQGQMYLRVNRGLRSPISSQLIFMPGNTAVTTATINQPHPQQESTSASKSCNQSDGEQVQNLAVRGVCGPKGVKTEAAERSDPGEPRGPDVPGNTQTAVYSMVQANAQPTPPKAPTPHIKIPTYPQPANLKAPPPATSSSSSSSLPLSQLLLHGTRTLTTGTAATPTFVLASNAAPQPQRYPVGTATIKPAVGAQTLVVQPLQKSSLSAEKCSGGPVPIQPKTLQGLRLPTQLPSRNPPPILPAVSHGGSSTQPPPHVPVQIVGARQSSQGLALARSGGSQEGGAVLTMVASVASRDGGVGARKPLQLLQDAPQSAQVSQVHPQTNQNRASAASPASSVHNASSCSSLSLPLVTDEPRGAPETPDGDASGPPQINQSSLSLKRKCESSPSAGDGPSPPHLQPIRDQTSSLKANHSSAAGSVAPPPPPSSSLLSVSRGVGGRAPPPQAVVKPHVLTHLIEGFVIQEGPDPFPVCGPIKDCADEEATGEGHGTSQSQDTTAATVLKCEYCKKLAPANQFRGTKRFCSTPCAKRYNVSFRRHTHRLSTLDGEEGGGAKRKVTRRSASETASVKLSGRRRTAKCRSESSRSDEDSSPEDEEDEEDEPVSLSPTSSSVSCHQPPPLLPAPLPPSPPTEGSAHGVVPATPAQWSVEEVSQFISSLQGCEDLASQFQSQEIDGQALLLLKEEHLMSTMNIKLGPALKICAHINTLRG